MAVALRSHSTGTGPWTTPGFSVIARSAVASEVLGLPGLVLMENASINTASVVQDVLEDAVELDEDAFRVSVLCGGGNNGGDGYAIARQLMGFGVAVTVFAARPVEELRGDVLVNAQACERLGFEVVPCADETQANACRAAWSGSHVVVDALLGTGFSGALREGLAGVIGVLNNVKSQRAEHVQVVAVDLPSGMNADTGELAEPTVKADVTVTFVAEKAGFSKKSASSHLGTVVVADIGLPDCAVRAALEKHGD